MLGVVKDVISYRKDTKIARKDFIQLMIEAGNHTANSSKVSRLAAKLYIIVGFRIFR